VEVIITKGNQILLQKRDGYVEMPGGGVDPGENLAQTAQREAMEEVGAKLKNLRPVGVVDAKWYPGIKETDWGMELWEQYRGSRTHFYIAEIDGALRTPTSDEGDRWYGVKWMDCTEALEFMYSLPNSYGMKEYRDKQKSVIIKALMEHLKGKEAADETGYMVGGNPLQEAEDIMDEADDRYERTKGKKKSKTYSLSQPIDKAARFITEGELRALARSVVADSEHDTAGDFLRSYTREQNVEKQAAEDPHWIGVDLDGTLAKYNGWVAPDHIGEPIPKMVLRIKRWLREGKKVKVFTARMAGDDGTARRAIQRWTREHIGQTLPVTNVKDQFCTRIWDDKAVGVAVNSGAQRTVGPGKW
jgi:8-oxo-dGTP pyrophosphatase MutT (NUDIX family)